MDKMKEIVAYCAANIEDWDLKVEMALRMIGRRMPIDPGFRNEIEDCVSEWADENEVELAEDFDAEDVVFYEE